MTKVSTVLSIACVLAITTVTGPAVAEQASASQGSAAQAQAAIETLLKDQAAAWTAGDLEAFVSIYAKDARFLSTTGLTEGRDKVLARYRKRYPDSAAMGSLSLDIEVFEAMSDAQGNPHGASVVARWTLNYPADAERQTISGLTLIVFRPTAEGSWEIIHDASM